MALDPIVTGSLISTGGGLVGGLFGKKSAKKAAKREYRRQKEFAQNQIQWKVADAKKAGLHPLYAMGGGSSSYSPNIMAGQDPMGTAIAEGAQTMGQAYAKSKAPPPGTPQGELGKAQLRAVNASAQRDEAAALRDLSAAKRMEANANITQDGGIFSGSGGGTVPSGNVPTDRVTPVAPDVRSRSRASGSRQSGKNPLWQRYQYGPKRSDYIDIPFSDEGPLEEFGPGKALATLIRALQNRAKSAPLPKRRSTRSNASRRRQRRRTRY